MLLLGFLGLGLFLGQVFVHQVVNDRVFPTRILIDLHQVRLLYLFYARLVKVFDWDGASELGIQC